MLSYDRSQDPTSVVSVAREAGYQYAMKRLGLERRTRIFRLSHRPGRREQELQDLIAQKDRPRAIFVWSDLDALPLMAACHKAGVDVPGELAIIGYDDCETGHLPFVGLSSLNQNPQAQGLHASQLLLSRIEGREEAQHVLVPPMVVLRRSG